MIVYYPIFYHFFSFGLDLEILLFDGFPYFSTFRVIVYFCFFYSFCVEGCYDAECLVQIVHFADCVFESAYLDEFFSPDWLYFLEYAEETLFVHADG